MESDESWDSDKGFLSSPLIIHWHVITNHSFVTAPEIGFNYSSMTPLFEEFASGLAMPMIQNQNLQSCKF